MTITIISEFRVNYYIPKNSDEGVAINLTTYPGLNCLEQEDPVLITALRDDILYPPSQTGDQRRSQTENNLDSLCLQVFQAVLSQLVKDILNTSKIFSWTNSSSRD